MTATSGFPSKFYSLWLHGWTADKFRVSSMGPLLRIKHVHVRHHIYWRLGCQVSVRLLTVRPCPVVAMLDYSLTSCRRTCLA